MRCWPGGSGDSRTGTRSYGRWSRRAPGGDPAAVAAWRRRHGLMTAAWEQLSRDGRGERAADGTVAGVRSSLPPDTAAFTGREPELELITGAVAEAAGGGMVAIRAIDGM